MLLYTTHPQNFMRSRTAAFSRGASSPSRSNLSDVAVPPMDVVETDGAYRVTFDVPGVTREQLKVSIEGKTVSIDTRRLVDDSAAAPSADDASRVIYSERAARDAARPFARRFTLPVEVDQAGAQAKLEHGVLVLTLPKKQPARAEVTIN